jgi:branched-chain amino acid transport system substrate-binding protein
MTVVRRALLSAAVVALVACGSDAPRPKPLPVSNTPPAQTNELPALEGPIRIGAVLPMTGSEATFGQSTLAGIQHAIAERNERGGVRGARIEVVTLDTAGKLANVASVVTRLIVEHHVVAIVGDVASASTLAGASVAQEHGVPMITPASTNPAVTEVGDRIFRACFLDDAQADAMARFAREELHVDDVAILSDASSAYSGSLTWEFSKDFDGRGGKVVLEAHYVTGSPIDPALVTQIRTSGADAVYVPGYYPDVATIAIALRKAGVTIPLLGGDGWDSPELGAIAGTAIDGSYYTNHFAIDDPREITRAFATRYAKDRGAPPDGLAALGYDATLVLLDAMERTASLDGADLSAAIAGTKLEGATGGITFAGMRDPTKAVVVLQLKAQLPHYVASITP